MEDEPERPIILQEIKYEKKKKRRQKQISTVGLPPNCQHWKQSLPTPRVPTLNPLPQPETLPLASFFPATNTAICRLILIPAR